MIGIMLFSSLRVHGWVYFSHILILDLICNPQGEEKCSVHPHHDHTHTTTNTHTTTLHTHTHTHTPKDMHTHTHTRLSWTHKQHKTFFIVCECPTWRPTWRPS